MTRSTNRRAVLWGRPLFFLLLAAAVAAALAAAVLWLRRAKTPPHVLLITIDTLRADALGERDSPALLDLARRGLRFTKARTPVPLTLPAHASLLGGIDPRRHGMRANTAEPLRPRARRGFDMLAEQFRDAGYATAAFVASAVLHPRFRLSAGFDVYRHPELQARGATGFRTRDATEQVALVKRWMESRPRDRPYFVWVHLWEPHAPYREYAGDARRPGTSREVDSPRQLYAGEVRKADWAVEELLKLVDEKTTVVAVTSDHGESLGEHDEATHGHLCYGATMNVPLILAGPGLAEGETSDRVCELTDLAPTLRKLCGLKGAGGTSLLALPEGRAVVGESRYAYGQYRWAQQLVAFNGRFSLVDGGPRYELFDLAADPGETAPLAGREAPPTLERALTLYRSGEDRGAAGGAFSPPQSPYGTVLARDLGFLKPAQNRRMPDVRPRLLPTEAALGRLNAAIEARSEALVNKTLPEVERLDAMDSANPALALARGRALLLVLGDRAAARRALEQAVGRGYARKDLEGLLRQAAAR